ncbi:MAG: hypothetical protein BWY83_02211 [bacterium ADurb.Bin478]|nr:MAG: hypothetical protein BWY83_02211 [bacterium ADurb.Bin478]
MRIELILLGCCLVACTALAREVSSTISQVTVYNSMALLQREVKLQLNAGENRIEIGHLPTALMDESVHIRLGDEGQVQISDVKVERWFLEKAEELQVKKIEEQIAALDLQDLQADNEIKALKSQEKFLTSIQVAADAKASQELLQAKMDVASWSSTLTFLRKNLTTVYNEITELELQRKQLDNKREALKKQLQQVQSARPKEEKSIQLLLQSKTALSTGLTVAYLVRDVAWSPTYELRALPAQDQVEMVYSAEVQQKTGEEWADVSLSLSTATPAFGAQAPELQPWYLNIYKPEPVMRMSKAAAAPQGRVAEEAALYSVQDAIEPSVVEAKGASVHFVIAGKRTISSGDEPTKVLIRRQVFPAALSCLTIPKMSQHAYLQGSFENSSEYPLIAGPAVTYVDGDYVGKSRLQNKAVGEKVELSLGIDPNIKIKHELVKRFERNKGMISKKTEIEYVYKITCENYRSKAAVITVQDQAPISRNEDVEVSDVKLTPNANEWNKETGKLIWNLSVAPKEKKEILISFVVSHPRDAVISGL